MLIRKEKSHETDPNTLSVARNCPKHIYYRTKLISRETVTKPIYTTHSISVTVLKHTHLREPTVSATQFPI